MIPAMDRGLPSAPAGNVIRAATTRERSVLTHPDQASTWTIVIEVELVRPVAPSLVDARLAELTRDAPIVGAHLDGRFWVRRTAPTARVAERGSLLDGVTDRFNLAREAPLRVRLSTDGTRVVVAGHHAAFDGLGLLAVGASLIAGVTRNGALDHKELVRPEVATETPNGERSSLARRLIRPADPVAKSKPSAATESLVAVDVAVSDGHVTARLASACVNAVVAFNHRRCAPMRRSSISLGIGGSRSIGNTASYQRVDVDLRTDIDVVAIVNAALTRTDEPIELRRPLPTMPNALRRSILPIVARLSDSFLVSNLGRIDLANARRVSFFPVARGRSAVAIGAASVERGRATLTLRARHLDANDANALLSDIAARFAED
jgi:hypothetical protein